MQVGGANVVVEVAATGTELQTMNATVGNTVTAIAIDNLPSIGRDVSTFIELQPGVSTGGDVGVPSTIKAISRSTVATTQTTWMAAEAYIQGRNSHSWSATQPEASPLVTPRPTPRPPA